MLSCLAELYSTAAGLAGDAAIAERDRLRLEDEAKVSRQPQLMLRGGA